MRESAAFRRQARADIHAGTLLGGATCAPDMRAHVLAKSQQSVEKVLKSAFVILADAAVVIQIPHVGAPHTNMRAPAIHDVSRIALAIVLKAAPAPRRRIPNTPTQAVARALTGARRRAIAHLDALVPSSPGPGALHRVNTEYPYEEAVAHDWRYPGAPATFTARETQWLFREADELVDELDRIITALELRHP